MSDIELSLNDGVFIPESAADLRTFSTSTDLFRDCPVLTKGRVFEVPKGVQAVLEWEVRNKAGAAIDLSDLIYNGSDATTPSPTGYGQTVFRFIDALGCDPTIHQIIGWGHDVDTGKVRVELTESLVETPGIYRLQVGITDHEGVLQTVDTGLLSIERGLFTQTELSQLDGPITIGEVRMYLRDTVVENDLLDNFEFSDAEIIHAIVRPIQQWNELPPDLGCFTACNFPFRYHWLIATVSNLLKTAAHWYRRNKLGATHGGVSVNDKDKDRDYLAVARDIDQEWLEFVRNKKIEINHALAVGSLNSPY